MYSCNNAVVCKTSVVSHNSKSYIDEMLQKEVDVILHVFSQWKAAEKHLVIIIILKNKL